MDFHKKDGAINTILKGHLAGGYHAPCKYDIIRPDT